jgi:uncharacterized membrane protein YphA (DoxX/SURF4 family)
MWNELRGYKTHILAIVTVIYALSAAFTGHMGWSQAIPMVLGSGMASALRSGIAKSYQILG